MRPFYEDDRVTIFHGDALDVLGNTRLGFDLAVLDPPYNVGKNYGPGCSDDLSPAAYESWIIRLLDAVHDVAEQVAYFPGTVNVPTCYGWLARTDWRFQRQLGWHKKEYAGDLFAAGPAMCWEPIVWATGAEAERRWNKVFGAWGRDFLVVNATHGDPLRAHHPCPKPPEVLRWLIGLFCPEGGTVLDPTMGTGTALLAAKAMGRRAVGIEQNEDYCALAVRRLGQGVLDLEVIG